MDLIKQGQEKGEVASHKSFRGNRYDNNLDNEGSKLSKPKTLKEVGLTPHQSMDYTGLKLKS